MADWRWLGGRRGGWIPRRQMDGTMRAAHIVLALSINAAVGTMQ